VVGEVETVCDFDGEPGWEGVVSACSYDESVFQVFLQKSWCAAKVFSVAVWLAL
jgi:hypothetical protein